MKSKKYSTYGTCSIADSATIQPGSLIGKKFRRFLQGGYERQKKTRIGDKVYVGFHCAIGNGSRINNNSIIDDRSYIESRVTVGKRTLIIYSAHICCDVVIGDNCVIGGFVGERTRVGNNCRIFGSIVHTQNEPTRGWDDDDSTESAATIRDNVFIGFNSVISAVTIGPKAYVCAGSIVTKDVPEGHIACGVNKFVHYSMWPGKLKNSRLFK